MDVGRGGRNLAEVGNAAREAVDVCHGEGNFGLLRGSEEMQHSIGGAAHGDVEGHGVLEGLEGGDAAGSGGEVVVLVVAAGQIDDGAASLEEELLAVGVGGHDGAIAGLGETERLVEAVHGVGGEHAGAGAAGGTGGVLVLVDLGVGGLGVGGENHGVDQVYGLTDAAVHHLARLHGPAGDEYGGDVEAQGGHHHAGGDLVAVGDADQRVGAVGVDHVLD